MVCSRACKWKNKNIPSVTSFYKYRLQFERYHIIQDIHLNLLKVKVAPNLIVGGVG